MQTGCTLTTRYPDRKRRQDDIKRAQAAAKQAAFRKQVKADMARDRQLRREARETSAARRREEQEKERTELLHKATVRVNGYRCAVLCVKGNTFTLLCGVSCCRWMRMLGRLMRSSDVHNVSEWMPRIACRHARRPWSVLCARRSNWRWMLRCVCRVVEGWCRSPVTSVPMWLLLQARVALEKRNKARKEAIARTYAVYECKHEVRVSAFT